MRSNLNVDDKDLRFKLTSSYARQISEERIKQNALMKWFSLQMWINLARFLWDQLQLFKLNQKTKLEQKVKCCSLSLASSPFSLTL